MVTACDVCRTQGTEAPALGDGLIQGGKIAIAGGERRFGEPPPDAPAFCPEAHELLGSGKTVAEVPLTELPSKPSPVSPARCPPTDRGELVQA